MAICKNKKKGAIKKYLFVQFIITIFELVILILSIFLFKGFQLRSMILYIADINYLKIYLIWVTIKKVQKHIIIFNKKFKTIEQLISKSNI